MANFINRNRASQPQGSNQSPNPPTHVAKVRLPGPKGERNGFERIGVAWAKEDGSLFVRLYGTQVVSGGFALYPVETAADGGAR